MEGMPSEICSILVRFDGVSSASASAKSSRFSVADNSSALPLLLYLSAYVRLRIGLVIDGFDGVFDGVVRLDVCEKGSGTGEVEFTLCLGT